VVLFKFKNTIIHTVCKKILVFEMNADQTFNIFHRLRRGARCIVLHDSQKHGPCVARNNKVAIIIVCLKVASAAAAVIGAIELAVCCWRARVLSWVVIGDGLADFGSAEINRQVLPVS
jgi:hypothetical protein